METRVGKILILAFILCLLWMPISQSCAAALDNRQMISINITGDVLLGRWVERALNIVGVEGVMKGVAPVFRSADYTMINLECPVTDIVSSAKKSHVFRADPSLLKGLRSVGVTHAVLANNHTLDQGDAGFIDTVRNLAKAGIEAVGVAKGNPETVSPEIIEKDGIKIAVFAVNMIKVSSQVRKPSEIGPCEASEEDMRAYVRSFHVLHPEVHVIVFLHWGEEYSLFPTEEQTAFAHALIDAGAAAVIGCHPHVIQGVEVYHGRPIAYSLGNLLFDQDLPETQTGLIITLVFGQDSMTGVTLHKVRQINAAPHLAGEMKLDLSIDRMILPSGLFP